ncbi:ABC transporter permease [Aestuariivivens sediminis]|uniref:ABC transporter permease n=1 Tax=Aestuariivivens sediminis TaxID=2913557 RepID=UPI001F58647A|nr:ABC transporter permease [Aestuariivivens sediminis]
MALETRVYQKENRLHFGKLLKASLHDIYASRFLSKQLAIRDISAQYRQSYLGILWAFITPLVTALVWILLKNSGTVRLSPTGIPYPVYAFAGTLIWSIITDSINAPMASTNSAKGLLTKLNFPKEALVISGIYKLLFNSAIKVLLLVVFVFAFGIGFHWSLLLFPFILLGAVLIGTAIGLFITPFGMLYKDIGKLISFGLTFLMYVTPVVYAIPKDGVMKMVMTYNPLTPIILTTRDFVTGQHPEHLSYFLVVMGCCIPLFVIGLVFYRLSIPIIVER